jgi:hypothetical protein
MMGLEPGRRKVLSPGASWDYPGPAMPRIFVAQTLADSWLNAGRVTLERDLLRLPGPDGNVDLFINPAVFFERIDGTETDVNEVVGRVKTAQELAQMGADHYESSVVMGDYAYTVVPGYLAIAVDARGTELALDGVAWGRLVSQIEALGS